MDSFFVVAEAQAILFFYMLVGVYARKRVIPKEGRKYFIDFLIQIALPCMVFESFNIDITPGQLLDASQALLISFVVCVFCIILGKILYRRIHPKQRSIMQYCTLISNSSFAGLPLIQFTYGSMGLFYASIFLIPLRIFMWSAGISLFIQADWKTKAKNVLSNPAVIAVFLGVPRLLLKIPLPAFMDTALKSIGNCTAPISMIVVGMILADIPWRTVWHRNALYLSAVRLAVIPLCVFAALYLLGVEPLMRNVSVLLTAMPAGATTPAMAEKYGADHEFASKCVFVSTLFSLVTVPLVSVLL